MKQTCELKEDQTKNDSNPDVLCKAEDIGLDSFLLCMIRNPRECRFSLYFGDVYFCKNTHRVSISKKDNK